MKILFLMKRQYMSRDIIDEQFGRYWELMDHLNRRGHEVHVFCLSYRDKKEGCVIDRRGSAEAPFRWHSINAGRLKPLGYRRYLTFIHKEAELVLPDIIYCCSDPLYIIAAEWLAGRLGVPRVCDIYDNLRTYRPYKIPGVAFFFRQALKKADGITPISRIIAADLERHYGVTCPMQTLSNGIDPVIFYPQSRDACRKKLGLPIGVPMIGTSGALFQNRGIHVFFEGYRRLASEFPDLHLAMSGPCDKPNDIPKGGNVHYFPNLPRRDVGVLMNAMDINIICNRDSAFGRYSFPQKAYEMIACRRPMAAASAGIITDLLADYPECLFEPDSVDSFVRTVGCQLRQPRIIDMAAPSWEDITATLENFLLQITRSET